MAEDFNQQHALNGPTKDVSRVQDVLVTMIVALIGTAVALGLYSRAGFAVVPAVSVGAGLFVWLLSAHFLITRLRLKRLIDQRLTHLSHEVSSLKKETEITDLLAEGHNELLDNQQGLEKAIQIIVERMDGYDQRLKALYKLGKKNHEQISSQLTVPQTDEPRFEELQQELVRLSQEIENFEQRFQGQTDVHYGLVKAELDVLAFVVERILTSEGEERARLSQKALAVIDGLRELPVVKAQHDAIQGARGLDLSGEDPGHVDLLETSGDQGERAPTDLLRGVLQQDRGLQKGLNEEREVFASSEIASRDEAHDEHLKDVDGSAVGERGAVLSEEALLAAVNGAIEANRIELYLQPIVALPDRDLVFYEGFARLRNELGQLMLPADYLATADMAGLTPIIDNQIILRAIQVVQRLVSRGKGKLLFCNLAIASLRDGDFFAEFMDFMEANKWLSKHMVFEFTQSALDEANAFDYERLKAVADLGFSFSLDEVARLDLDFKALSEMNFRFVKVGASLLLGNVASARAEIHPADLGPYLNRLNLTLIVDHVEREAVVRQLRDYNVQFAQGLCFCEPKPVRPEVFAEQSAYVA